MFREKVDNVFPYNKLCAAELVKTIPVHVPYKSIWASKGEGVLTFENPPYKQDWIAVL